MATDPKVEAHRAWIGLAQPVGLVVAPAALLRAGVVLPERVGEAQEAFRKLVGFEEESGAARVASVRDLLRHLEWPEQFIVQKDAWGDLSVPVPEYQDTLVPSLAVKDPDAAEKFILLVKEVPDGADLDATGRDEGNGRWHASHQARLERLLKATGIPIGLLFNGACVRLVYAPQGESSGYVTFPFKTLCDTANRPMLAALHMLLGADRLFTLGTSQRLPALLAESRKYQNTVTEKLAEQVLAALNDLLDGVQQADRSRDGMLLRDVVREQPQLVYEGLVSVMMRLVFLLYAEERGVLPQDPYYQDNYGVLRLFERLRDDDALYTDTMGQRYGAWAQLMTLFRMVFEGMHYEVDGKPVHVPPRQGDLFSPDRFGFLEGRPLHVGHCKGAKENLPLVPDATVFRVLRNLLILDGERLSYRALDVEQIGSVYEALMGFELDVAKGPSISLRPKHVVVNLDELLKAKDREKFLSEQADVKVTGEAQKALKAATTVDQLKGALERRKSDLTQRDLGVGDLFFQVTNERRRSGSHYTPRSLTEPIVDTTLKPLVDALGPSPTPQQILDLKVCDPAMGSGAFLVAACRWLGDKLLAAWQSHGMPRIPPDEDPVLHARRIVSLNCLYGVDKNPFAVNLAKLSLWLATLAKDHPFTFLDHALKGGDSLVGLDLEQISCLSWDTTSKEKQVPLAGKTARDALKGAEARRAELRALGDTAETERARYLHRLAEEAAEEAELIGDHIVAAFFSGENAKARNKRLDELASLLTTSKRLPPAELDGLKPFHWQLEFPEVFDRINGGFAAFLANPPFVFGEHRQAIIKDLFSLAAGQWDTYWLFLERASTLLRPSNSGMGFVVPDAVLAREESARVREFVCKAFTGISVVHLGSAFPGAAVSVVSLVARKSDPEREPATFSFQDPSRRVSRLTLRAGAPSDWHAWSLEPEAPRAAGADCVKLSELCKISRGEEIGKKGLEPMPREAHLRPGLVPILAGEGIAVAFCQPVATHLVAREELTKDPAIYGPPKIVLLKTGARLRPAIDRVGLVTMQSVYGLHLVEQRRKVPIEVVAAALWSDAVHSRHIEPFTAAKKVFAQITMQMIKDIQVPLPSPAQGQEIVRLVRRLEVAGLDDPERNAAELALRRALALLWQDRGLS